MKVNAPHQFAAILCVALAPLISCSQHTNRIVIGHALKITGTFTNLRVTDQGVFGAEVRIAIGAKPFRQAVVQFGVADACNRVDLGTERCFHVSNLHLAEVVLDEAADPRPQTARISFEIPGTDWDAGRFEGVLTDEALEGTFTPKVGLPRAYKMVRGVSHWDQ